MEFYLLSLENWTIWGFCMCSLNLILSLIAWEYALMLIVCVLLQNASQQCFIWTNTYIIGKLHGVGGNVSASPRYLCWFHVVSERSNPFFMFIKKFHLFLAVTCRVTTSVDRSQLRWETCLAFKSCMMFSFFFFQIFVNASVFLVSVNIC